MSNRNLFILGLAAAVMVVVAVVLSGISSRPYAPANAPAYLIQGLDPDQIASITIGSTGSPSKGKSEEQVILNRRGRGFVVASKDNYPALTSEINKLITTCLDIQTAEMYTDNPANHKDLGVTEEDARHLVKFYKADSTGSTGSPQSLLTGVVIGKPIEKSMVGYVRRAEDNKVYVMAAQVPWIKKRAIEYVDQELTNVKREDINSVTVSGSNPATASASAETSETYVIKPGADDKGVILENMPEGKVLKNKGAVAEAVFTALADLRFDDVNADGSRRDLKFDRKYACRLRDSTVYTFGLVKKDDKWFAKCDALFMDKTPVTKTQGEVESEDQLKKKEAKLLANDAAEEFSEKHNGWIYQIANNKAENLTKPIAELVEDIKVPTIGEPNKATDENLQEKAEEDAELSAELNSPKEQ
jgi:hypothetical protein